MSLGHVANARADRAAAASWFERAARAAPDAAAAARLALAAALRDLGDFDAAAAAAEAVLARNPDEAEAWMSLGHTERRAGRREAALEAFARASELEAGQPRSPGPDGGGGAPPRPAGGVRASCSTAPSKRTSADAEALLQFGEHFRLAGALDRALGMFRRAMASPRPIAWAWLAASQVLVDTGGLEAAFRTLEDAEARFGPKPEIAAKRVELLRRTGDWAAACDAADRAAATWPHHFGVWFERAHLERIRGGQEAHAASLREAPAGNTHERARVHLLEGLLAAERWRFDEAAGALRALDRAQPRRRLAAHLPGAGAAPHARHGGRAGAAPRGVAHGPFGRQAAGALGEHLADASGPAARRVHPGRAGAGGAPRLRGLAPGERVEPMLALVRRYPGVHAGRHRPPDRAAPVGPPRAAARRRPRRAARGRRGRALHPAQLRAVLGRQRRSRRPRTDHAELGRAVSGVRAAPLQRRAGPRLPCAFPRRGGAGRLPPLPAARAEGGHLPARLPLLGRRVLRRRRRPAGGRLRGAALPGRAPPALPGGFRDRRQQPHRRGAGPSADRARAPPRRGGHQPRRQRHPVAVHRPRPADARLRLPARGPGPGTAGGARRRGGAGARRAPARRLHPLPRGLQEHRAALEPHRLRPTRSDERRRLPPPPRASAPETTPAPGAEAGRAAAACAAD